MPLAVPSRRCRCRPRRRRADTVPEASPPGLPPPPVAKAGFLWRMVERRRAEAAGPSRPPARPLSCGAAGGAGQGTAAWVQMHGAAGRSVFVIGPVGDAAVRRFALAMHGRGWSVDLCDDAEAAVASVTGRPRGWHMVALFGSAGDFGPLWDEAWDELCAAVPALPLLRFHREGGVVRRIDLRNMRDMPRSLPGLQRSAAGNP